MSTLPQPNARTATVDDALTAFLAHFERRVANGARSAATLSMHRGHAQLISRALPPGTRLVRLDAQLLEQLAGAAPSGATARKRLGTLFGALREAHRRGALRALPARPEVDHVYRPGQRHLRSWAELQALCAALPPTRAEWVIAGVLTGMHARNLNTWRAYEDVDPFAGWMILRNNKNRTTPIRVRMPRELARVLRERFERLGTKPGDLALRPWLHGTRGHQLRAAARRAGVDAENATALRHTCGTWLVRRLGVSVGAAKWLGHKSTSMLERVYAHALPPQLEELSRELDSMEDAGESRPPSQVSGNRVGNPPPSRGAKEVGPEPLVAAPGPESAGEGPLSDASVDRTAAELNRLKNPENSGDSVPRDRVELSTHGFSERLPAELTIAPAQVVPPGKEEGPPCTPPATPMPMSCSSPITASSPPSSTTRRSRSG
jgi:integrase